MIFISPLINILLWVGYLGSALIIVWGLVPRWGGWRTLNLQGKVIVISAILICLICLCSLIFTTVRS